MLPSGLKLKQVAAAVQLRGMHLLVATACSESACSSQRNIYEGRQQLKAIVDTIEICIGIAHAELDNVLALYQ